MLKWTAGQSMHQPTFLFNPKVCYSFKIVFFYSKTDLQKQGFFSSVKQFVQGFSEDTVRNEFNAVQQA